ncbi:hypothetical protein CgunFtcFv8_017171 [Champsocephalus gunnari]|uniref:Uncharacterized protein n=1 Tax=Champsocephalus gunnari TaxID=52237 RepID=A0AAN8DUQ5_CHAGU|nr:hypothetical protein CgunFtcFv8_017171 [Champsocephalus gunnari]
MLVPPGFRLPGRNTSWTKNLNGEKTGRFNCPVIVSACEDAESGKCRQSFEMSGAFNRIVTTASERRGTLQSLNERKHTSKMLSVSDQTVFLNERTRREDAC